MMPCGAAHLEASETVCWEKESPHYYWPIIVAQLVKNPLAMQETLVRFLGQEESLEKGTAINSSILAWRVPWTEELSSLQSMGSQRVRLN